MSTLATTNIKHESASTPNITLGADGTSTVNGTLNLGSSPLATPTGSAPSYTCRAWVNFNGTGTVAIRASGNVSSITDNGTGDYTVNFTTAMPDADYAGSMMNNQNNGAGTAGIAYMWSIAKTTTTFRVGNVLGGAVADSSDISIAIFR
jgi:hypothetical protein